MRLADLNPAGRFLFPATSADPVISGRASRRASATAAISAQRVPGPALVLPYTAPETTNGHTSEATRYLSLLPDARSSTGTLAPERRHRRGMAYAAAASHAGDSRTPAGAYGCVFAGLQLPDYALPVGSRQPGARSGAVSRAQ